MSQAKPDTQLMDGDGGVLSGRLPDVTQHHWSEFGGSANRFHRLEVPSPSEGCRHPTVDRRGTQGVHPMKAAEFTHDVAVLLTLSGKQVDLRPLDLLGVVHGQF